MTSTPEASRLDTRSSSAHAPLNLLLSIPAKVLFGDYRYGLLAALIASLMLFRQTGKRLGICLSHGLLTMAALLHPRLDRLVILRRLAGAPSDPAALPFVSVCLRKARHDPDADSVCDAASSSMSRCRCCCI